MIQAVVDDGLIASIASRLDLREPNRRALDTIAKRTAQHYDVDEQPPPFEGVVDAATGVGKTYILAASIEYFAALGHRNFAIIVPGRTILDKTVGNFSHGHHKSLLPSMEVEPVVVTADNFATPAMRAAMDDEQQVKVYIFTVQALVKPTTKVGRRTHKFQEGLGTAFYEHLDAQDDLIVLADEHHCYYGDAFSKAVRDLTPFAIIGLTATPHRKTPKDQIIFQYPLAAAIADKLVKTPVIVGRKDDRSDSLTKLTDGCRLLEYKAQAIERYRADNDLPVVNPVMLVIAKSIEEANEYGAIIADESFLDGRYRDAVLVVHSNAPDKALAELEQVEQPDSPVRIIISVGMLKEGWDVKNVYVIASMRASVSEVLTEQTLGRGLRLPYGRYTGLEILDTLEVLAHERYEDLLRRAGAINQAFIDYQTWAVMRRDAQGNEVYVTETAQVEAPVHAVEARSQSGASVVPPSINGPGPWVGSVEDRHDEAGDAVTNLQLQLWPREVDPPLVIPRLVMKSVTNDFSLSDVTDLEPFRKLGLRIGADPVEELRRTRLSARVVESFDGFRQTQLVTAPAVDKIESSGRKISLDEGREALLDQVLASPVVPSRRGEAHAAERLIDAFLDGMGQKAEEVLSAYLDRAAGGLIALINDEHRRFVSKPKYDQVVETYRFGATRTGREKVTQDRAGKFVRGVGYDGWAKSLYGQEWFDSSTERDVALILDDANEVDYWLRLQRGDLPILWSSAGRDYNPDFIAAEGDRRWVVEVKMDREMTSHEVAAKKEAALRWANYVNRERERVGGIEWGYMLASETTVRTCKGSWDAMKRMSLNGAYR